MAILLFFPALAYSQCAVTQLWKAENPGDEKSSLVNAGIKLDSLGNVYWIGKVVGKDFLSRNIFKKWGSGGKLLWEAELPPFTFRLGENRPIDVNGLGQIVVSGESRTEGKFIAKLDGAGKLLWSQNNKNPSSGLAFDGMGNIGEVGGNWTVSEYSPDGKQLWTDTKHWDGKNFAKASGVGFDAQGNMVVVGFDSPGNNADNEWLIRKYSQQGKVLWEARNGGGERGSGMASIVAVDPSGDIYVSGFAHGVMEKNEFEVKTTHLEWSVQKYDESGKFLWETELGEDKERWPCEVHPLALDPKGNLYALGYDTKMIYKIGADGKILAKAEWTQAEEKDFFGFSSLNGSGVWGISTSEHYHSPLRFFSLTGVCP